MYILLSFLAVLLFYLYWKRRFFLLSPVDFFIFYFVAVLIATTLYHFYFPRKEKFNFYNLDFISIKTFYKTVFLFAKMIVLFVIGVYCYSAFSNNYRKLNQTPIRIIDLSNLKLNIKRFETIAIVLLVLSVILVYIDYGSGIFVRSEYIPKKSSILKTIYQNLFIILSVVSGILYKYKKHLSLFCIIITIIVGIALGSRAASIYLILYGLFLSLFIGSRRGTIFFYAWFIPFVVIFFGFNLSLRSEGHSHGLVPYVMVVINNPLIIFKYVLSNIYYTLIFGFFDTVKTIKEYSNATIDILITCLNPLPGFLTDWPKIWYKLRVYDPLPYTAIGEMSKFPVFSLFYYSILGFYFSHIDMIIKKSIIKKQYIFSIIQYLLLILYVIHSFEYNLRSTHRFVVYSAFLLIIWHYFGNMKFVVRTRTAN